MLINYREYPLDWLTDIRPRIIRRAANKCEQCGIVNYSVVHKRTRIPIGPQGWDMIREMVRRFGYNKQKAIRTLGFTEIVLTVAHLNHVKSDCRDENLRALCQKCHLHYDMSHHVRNRKYGRKARENNLALFSEASSG